MAHLVHAARARRMIGTLGATAIEEAERALDAVKWFEPIAVAQWIVAEPLHAAIALALLGDRPHTLAGERVAHLFPELAALAVPTRAATHEHQRSEEARPTPLLDHVFRAMREAMSLHVDALPHEPSWRAIFTTALLFADVSKGGTDAMRADWLERLGVDGAVHNEDSAVVLDDVLRRLLGHASPFRDDPRARHRARALCATTGLVGMRLRGEITDDAFAAWHSFLHEDVDRASLARVWSAIDRCDTAAVRDGLWTPSLARAFAEIERDVCECVSLENLRHFPLAERVARFRSGASIERAHVTDAEAALQRLGAARAPTEARLRRCRTWYAEAALGPLSLDGTVRLLALLAGVASKLVDVERPWHLDLLGVVGRLRDERGASRTYPVRLLEALLAATSDDDLLEGELSALVSFPMKKGGEEALLVSLQEGEEANALLTLLTVYERKEAAAFHATLKSLCDLYGLRKDDFDRVSNEVDYLATMNAARSDKARMIDHVVPGLVVEVGPGGGVVLDLLAERFDRGRVVGIDASSAVVDALTKRRAAEQKRWEIQHGDAFALERVLGPRAATTVIFCSVLHEIFSYVPWPLGEPAAKRFQLASVDAIVASAFRALAPGGRIVVRDGVMPEHGARVVELLDPAWRQGLDLFAERWEARRIELAPLDDRRVTIDAADLLEFITTWTWGAASFPYEIREQRAVLPRDVYVKRMLGVCAEADPPHRAREIPVPPELASYLQPGYAQNVAPHMRIFDERGREVGMPDVTGVWVIEKI